MSKNKELILKMEAYANKLKNKLSDVVLPAKHLGREKEYKAFLELDLKKTMIKITALKEGS